MATFIEVEGVEGTRLYVNLDNVNFIEATVAGTLFVFDDVEDNGLPSNSRGAEVLYRAKQAGATVAEMPRTRRGPEGGE